MTKEEYCESVYNEKSWIYDIVAFDYGDDQKYYIGLEYNKDWPEQGWFYILMKVYKNSNYEKSSIYHNVRVYTDYINKRKATDEERKLLVEELYKKNWKVVREKDDWGFVEYKVEKIEKDI